MGTKVTRDTRMIRTAAAAAAAEAAVNLRQLPAKNGGARTGRMSACDTSVCIPPTHHIYTPHTHNTHAHLTRHGHTPQTTPRAHQPQQARTDSAHYRCDRPRDTRCLRPHTMQRSLFVVGLWNRVRDMADEEFRTLVKPQLSHVHPSR